MLIKSVIAGAAIAAGAIVLSVGMGPAYSADQFSALERVQVTILSPAELARTRGNWVIVHDRDGNGFVTLIRSVGGNAGLGTFSCPDALGCFNGPLFVTSREVIECGATGGCLTVGP